MLSTKKSREEYKNIPKYDPDLYDDLAQLGWEYTCGRMSRSGMEVYDQIMTRLRVLDDGEHWNEDCYQDHNCDH